MNKIPNRQAICEVLMDKAKDDKDIMVLCSDSRGSASMTPFADNFPNQFIETGIAEQNLVSISAGLAKCGKKPFACSPACFLSTRSYEQAKVDVAYSNTNVTLIGISGGISYGALGMSHHSAQDIAAMSAIPNMRVYLPSDRHQTKHLIEALLKDEKPSYIRVGRNPVEDIYTEDNCPFEMDKATVLKEGTDVAIIACGASVITSIVIVALGVVVSGPLTPIIQAPVLQPAFDYVVPALFGGLVAQTVIKGKKEIFHYLIPLAVCLFFCYCTKVASAYYMLIVIAVSAAVAVMDYLKTEKKEERGE